MPSQLHLALIATHNYCKRNFGRTHLIDEKSPGDFVTDVDRESNIRIREELEEAFPGVPIFGEEDENNLLPDILPDGEWIGFDPIDGTGNYMRGNSDWGMSAFKMINGFVVGSVVLSSKGLVGVVANDHCDNRLTSLRVSSNSKSILAAIPISPKASKKPHCVRYQNFLYEKRLINGLHGYGCAVANIVALLNGHIDAYINPGSGDVLDLAALQLIVEKAGGVVVDEFGKNVLWKQRYQNVIFARNYEIASKFFMPRDYQAA